VSISDVMSQRCELRGGRSHICPIPILAAPTTRTSEIGQSASNACPGAQNSGKLGMIIRMECGLEIPDKLSKYDWSTVLYVSSFVGAGEMCEHPESEEIYGSNMQVSHMYIALQTRQPALSAYYRKPNASLV